MYIFVLSLEPKMTCFLLLISLLRRKIAYVMLTSIPWEGLNSWVGATNLANIESDHDFNVHVKNSQSYTVLLLVSGDFFSLQIKTRFTTSTGLNLNIVLVDVLIAEVSAIYYTYIYTITSTWIRDLLWFERFQHSTFLIHVCSNIFSFFFC